MTDLHDLQRPPGTTSRIDDRTEPPGHAGSPGDAGASGVEHGGSPPEPPPGRSPRWRWVALAVALLAVGGLVAMALAYQGS